MLLRKLFCVADPTHAAYTWAVESRFLHVRAFDPCGQTLAQDTRPVAGTDPGEVRCAVCGAPVFVAGLPAEAGQTVACDILGRCQAQPADANLARLERLVATLAQAAKTPDKARLAPVAAALFAAVAADAAALAVLEAQGLNTVYPEGDAA